MATDTAPVNLEALPIELRVHIFQFVLDASQDNRHMHFCGRHKPSMYMHRSSKHFHERLRDLAHLLRTSKLIRADIEFMKFDDWRANMCMAHIVSPEAMAWQGLFWEPFELCWGWEPEMSWEVKQLPSTPILRGPSVLASVLRYMSHVHLAIEFGAITDGKKANHSLSLMHWCAVDKMRYLVLALNASERRKTLHVNVKVKSLNPWTGEHGCTLVDLRRMLAKLEALRDNIALEVKISFDSKEIMARYRSYLVTHSEANQPQKPYSQYLDVQHLDDKYMTQLQDTTGRSKHFPQASLIFLMQQWANLLMWTRGAFGYVSMREMGQMDDENVADEHYATMLYENKHKVNALLKTAWEAHDQGDKDKFQVAKQALYEEWRVNVDTHARGFAET